MDKIKLVLIASGGGTDAYAIMKAYRDGFMPNVSLEALISTKEGAGCLDKAKSLGIPTFVIDRKEVGSKRNFNKQLTLKLNSLGCDLLFLVGCIVKIEPMTAISIYNIHPADTHKFGGNGMYGLKVHERVLAEVQDLIARGKKSYDDDFFTYPTVHEAVLDYDSGQPLLSVTVKIPDLIIFELINEGISLTEAARLLQEHVLPFEWAILPTAVNIAAMKILNVQ
jgi:phosphoribosylglycinamide formyltransferase-1